LDVNGLPQPLVPAGGPRFRENSNARLINILRAEIKRIERSYSLDKSYIPKYQQQIEELLALGPEQKEAGHGK